MHRMTLQMPRIATGNTVHYAVLASSTEIIVISYTTAGRRNPSNLYSHVILINLGISSASKSFPLNQREEKLLRREMFLHSHLDRVE